MSEIDHMPYLTENRMAALWLLIAVLMIVDLVGVHLSLWSLTGPVYFAALVCMLVLVGVQTYEYAMEKLQ